MKRISKLFLLVLLVASFIIPSFGVALVAFAQTPISTIGASIVISQMPSKGRIGTTLNIPKGSSPDGTVTVTVKDPKGATVSLTDAGSTYSFNPEFSGSYKVQYAVVSADETVLASTYSREYVIVVAGEKPSFNFEVNSSIVLPETVNYGSLITLPYPTITNSNGEEVALVDALPNLVITVKNPQGQTITLGETTVNSITYKTFTPLEVAGEGVYTIDYFYTDAANLSVRKVFELTVDNSFNKNNIKLSYSLSGSMPESAVLGNKVTLPKAVTRNQNAGNALIRTYVEVSVKYLNKEGADVVYAVDNFSFTPLHKGDYQVVYKVYNYFGLLENKTLGEYTYTIKNVKDTEAPKVMPVENYLQENIDSDTYNFVNVSYNIPSNVAVGATVQFPAIHATDNYSLSSNLTFKRAIINSKNVITDLDVAANLQNGYNQTVAYTFLEEGTYTVRYYATDEAGNERSVSYSLKVVDGFIDTVAPRITMPTIPSFVKTGDVVKFLKPTAIDYLSTSSTTTVDTRVEVKTFFYLGDSVNTAIEINEDEKDSNYLSFTVPTGISEQYINILVEAKDDGKNNSGEVNVATQTRRINLLDMTDIAAPTQVGNAPVITPQNQGTVVNIPTVKFTDDNPTFVSVSVEIKDPNGNRVSVSNLQIAYELDTLSGNDADGIKVSAGRFIAVLAGNYRITYTATDVANNSYVISYTQYINDTQAPSFNLGSVQSKVEVGQTIILPTPTIMDNGVVIENKALTTIVFIDSPAYTLNLATYQFVALEQGVYSFKYIAEDAAGNVSESAVYSFTASDTIKPTIILNDTMPFPATAPLTRVDANSPYDAISIPDFTPFDEFNGVKEYSVTIKNTSGTVILEAKNGATAANGTYSFVPTKDGSYTVTYSVTDLAGNVTTDVRTVRVGDTAAPTLTIGNTAANKPGNKKLNATITLDLSAITISDVKDGNILVTDTTTTGLNKFTVTLTAPDNSVVSPTTAGTYNYKLTQAGEYTLTYTVRDEAGNTKVESTVFQVSANEAGLNTITETLAIVLIVIALLALAGVVVYFIRSREIIEE